MSMNCGCLVLSTVSPLVEACKQSSRADTSKLGVYFFTDSTDEEQIY